MDLVTKTTAPVESKTIHTGRTYLYLETGDTLKIETDGKEVLTFPITKPTQIRLDVEIVH